MPTFISFAPVLFFFRRGRQLDGVDAHHFQVDAAFRALDDLILEHVFQLDFGKAFRTLGVPETVLRAMVFSFGY